MVQKYVHGLSVLYLSVSQADHILSRDPGGGFPLGGEGVVGGFEIPRSMVLKSVCSTFDSFELFNSPSLQQKKKEEEEETKPNKY